jgi:hypothetical protein
MKPFRRCLGAVITTVAITITAAAALPPEDTHSRPTPPSIDRQKDRDRVLQYPGYLNKPLSYWLSVIRNRDERMISLAFDAIRGLGPNAWAAVPDLTRLMAAPFTPIQIGKDTNEAIASKVYDIAVRTEAIDTLAVIGESASTATPALVGWALTPRIVVPDIMRNADDDELFIELVMMDTEQRMRVAGAIAEFGPDAATAIAALITSDDAEKRKLGVAILNQNALPVAAELLRSSKCEERALGFRIVNDMELGVAKPYLDELMRRLTCEAN